MLGVAFTSRPLFFDEGCLEKSNPRVRKIPFYFKKPNLTEMNRIYSQLVSVSVCDKQEETVLLPAPEESVVKEEAPSAMEAEHHEEVASLFVDDECRACHSA